MEDGSPPNSSRKRSLPGTPGSSHQLPACDSGVSSCLLRPLDDGGAPLASRLAGLSSHGLVRLSSNKVYTFGRRGERRCDVGFCGVGHRCVSRRHCQLFLDSSRRKLLLVDGFLLPSPSNLVEARRRFKPTFDPIGKQQGLGARPSLNGIFVNGCRLGRGSVIELSIGDEVSFGCQKWVDHGYNIRYGFVVERVDFFGEFPRSDADNLFAAETKRICKTVMHMRLGHDEVLKRAVSLLTLCRRVLESADPIKYIKEGLDLSSVNKISPHGISCRGNTLEVGRGMNIEKTFGAVNVTSPEGFLPCNTYCDQSLSGGFTKDTTEKINSKGFLLPSDGKLLFLNRLEFMDTTSPHHCNMVSLPELFHPIGSLERVFVATFTSDIPWY